jgi:PIN domain nuclease of toxin-antitoxin system
LNVLLDTHAFLWWRTNSSRMSAKARRAVVTADAVLISAASAWEIAVKLALGKLRLADPVAWMVDDSGFAPLHVTFAHTERLATLPRHHRDPFDRMLIAQAQVEGVTLVTHDKLFQPYDIPILWT